MMFENSNKTPEYSDKDYSMTLAYMQRRFYAFARLSLSKSEYALTHSSVLMPPLSPQGGISPTTRLSLWFAFGTS